MEECRGTEPRSPWPPWVSFLTTASALPAAALGTVSLWRGGRGKLLPWAGAWGLLTTVSRRYICARCPYYGEHCSTLFGRLTPLMWERDERLLTTRSFYWDIALAPILFVLPAPDAYRVSKRLFIAYLAAWALFLGTLHTLGCRRCPLTVCPFNPSR
ncbi:MAG: hypothetical protein H5T74_13080 [Actinobacteria bacterium]|nr:hypothetical protein [Actinomycetota bacterium]MDI6831225.1 hypothetical protein [Actinomycetota bacterium]